jgi:hypothetical protein
LTLSGPFSAGQKLSASILSLIVTRTPRAFPGCTSNADSASPHPRRCVPDAREGSAHRESDPSGGWVKICSDAQNLTCSARLIPNLSRDAAALLVWNCCQLHISSAKLAHPFESHFDRGLCLGGRCVKLCAVIECRQNARKETISFTRAVTCKISPPFTIPKPSRTQAR